MVNDGATFPRPHARIQDTAECHVLIKICMGNQFSCTEMPFAVAVGALTVVVVVVSMAWTHCLSSAYPFPSNTEEITAG